MEASQNPVSDNPSALSTTLVTQTSQAKKAKKYLYQNFFRPLARHIDSNYYWVFIDILKIHHSIKEVMDSSGLMYIPKAIKLFNKLQTLQKFIIGLIMPLQQMMEQMPEAYADLTNIRIEESMGDLWIDRAKILAALRQPENLAKITEFNIELLQHIQNCVKVYTPFHPECTEEKLDEKNENARALLQKLKLSSYNEIIVHAKFLHKYFNKDYFITECMNILQNPPEQAIILYKRFFLSAELAVLILYKLINEMGHNALSGRAVYAADMRLIKTLVNLEFEFDINRLNMQDKMDIDTFFQRNLFCLFLNYQVVCDSLMTVYHNSNVRMMKMSNMVLVVEGVSHSHKFIRDTLKELDTQAELNDFNKLAPTSLEYAHTIIDEIQDFFNRDEINKWISGITDNVNQKLLKDGFFEKLRTTVTHSINLMIAKKDRFPIPNLTLDFFDFETIGNKLQLKKAEHCENLDINNFIQRDLLCEFVNKFNPAEPNDYAELEKHIEALDEITTGLGYCLDYDNRNAQVSRTLNELNFAICGSKKPVAKTVAKTDSRTSKPKILAETKIDDQENFKLLLSRLTADYSDLTKKMEEFQGLIQQADGVLKDNANRFLAELTAATATISETIKSATYSPEIAKTLSIVSEELNSLLLKLKNAYTSLNQTLNSQHNMESNSFQVIHTKLVQGFNEYNNQLSKAEKKLLALKTHATTKNGRTEKPLFPDFDQVILELENAAKSMPATLQLTQYSKENMIVITAARDHLDIMETKLKLLNSRLSATENYFYGKPGGTTKDNYPRPSRTLG